MAETTAQRVTRMLAMMAVLGTGEAVPVAEFAARFGVAPAQVQADIDTLMVAGIPGYFSNDLIDFDLDSYFDDHLVILRDGQGVERPMRLSAREAVSILAALQAIAAMLTSESAEYDLVHGLIDKVKAATETSGDVIDIEVAPDDRGVLSALRQAIAERSVVQIEYARADDTLSTRLIEPLLLTVSDAHTYLVAWSRDVDAERLFRVDRIMSLIATQETFPARPVAPRQPFDGAVRGEQLAIHIKAAARWVAEDIPTERVVDNDDGTFRVWLRVSDEAWLRQLLLRIAPDVIDVIPSQAAEPAAQAAQAALDAYRRLG